MSHPPPPPPFSLNSLGASPYTDSCSIRAEWPEKIGVIKTLEIEEEKTYYEQNLPRRLLRKILYEDSLVTFQYVNHGQIIVFRFVEPL